jgi:HTH-type transcriptional regulator/antitoxin HigA
VTSAVPLDYVEFEPDYAVAPGDFLEAVLRRLDLSQSELADRTGLSTKYINQLVNKKATLSPETAVRLETVTGVAVEIWARLEAEFRAAEARADRAERMGDWIPWVKQFNLAELRDRGIVTTTDPRQAADELLRFFAISTPEGWDRVWQPSLTRFRRSPSFVPEVAPTTIWLRIGQRKAVHVSTKPYSAQRLTQLLPTIRRLTRKSPSEGLAELPQICSDAGLAVVYAAELKGCRASGATWWAKPDKAVILLSNRGKREDRLWFSFFHEVGHLLKHAKRDTYIDQSGPDSEDPPWSEVPPSSGFIDDGSRDSVLEREADEFASSTLIPGEAILGLHRAQSRSDIELLALDLDISPGVVAGRWQFETGDFSKFNQLRRPLPDPPFET